MTKQEEIRGGMIERLAQILISCHINDHREQARYIIDTKFLPYLHSQGVVIKGERELPEFYTSKMPTVVGDTAGRISCGFFEPLIKEVKDNGLAT